MLLNEYPHINDPPKQVPCNYVECVSVIAWDAGGRREGAQAVMNAERKGTDGEEGCTDVTARGGGGYWVGPWIKNTGVKLQRAACLCRDPVGLTQ